MALASQPALAQTGEPDVAVVKICESYGDLSFDSARTGSLPEHRTFTPKDLLTLAGNKAFGNGQAEATRRLLAELAQQGYSVTTI